MQSADTGADRGGRPRRVRVPALAAAGALIAPALLVAGCGGGGHPPGVANFTNSHTTTTANSTTNGGGSAPPASSGRSGSGLTSGFAIAGGNRTEALKLSECMRAHGVPNFPDPNNQGVISGTGFNPNSASFEAAMNKCRQYAPNGGKAPSPQQQAQLQADALHYAECMRSHGVTNYPDPTFGPDGRVSLGFNARNGTTLDPTSPIFQSARKACQSVLRGRGNGLPPPTPVGNGE